MDIVGAAAQRPPARQLRPVLSLAEVQALRAAVEAVYIDPVIRRWVIQLVRATRGPMASRSAHRSAGASRSSALRARGRCCDGREYVTPVDVEGSLPLVVMHRIVFTPSFVATAREIGWTAAADRFREQCVEIAPRPGAELEPEDESALAVAQ